MRSKWAALLAAAGMLGLAGCGGASSAPATTAASASPASKPAAASSSGVTVRLAASQNVTGNSPVWLTGQAGLFQKNGLTADLQSINATAAIKTLVAGHIDGLIAGAPESISARAEGAAIQIVAVFQHSCDMNFVAAKDVTAVEQLKGRTIAVITKPSVNGICTLADMRNHGLQADRDYAVVETGANGTYAAMVAGIQAHHADAGAMQTDFAQKLTADGSFHVLHDLAKEQNLREAASSLTFSESFIKDHPAEVQKTLDSLLQGQVYFTQHKDEAQGVLKNIFKIDGQSQLDQIYARQIELMASDVTPTKDLFPDIMQALGEVQPKVQGMNLDPLLNPRFAQDALQRGLRAN